MKDERVLYRPNEQVQLEVQLKDETVWLNVNQIALLFDRDRTVMKPHITTQVRFMHAHVVA